MEIRGHKVGSTVRFEVTDKKGKNHWITGVLLAFNGYGTKAWIREAVPVLKRHKNGDPTAQWKIVIHEVDPERLVRADGV